MPHRHGLITIGLFAGCTLVACEKDKLKGPEAEVKKTDVKLSLPEPKSMSFDVQAGADGSHTVKEMRVKGKKLLNSEITIKGFVTWAYDCKTAIQTPGQTPEDVQKIIDEDPTKCERAKFYIGDAADTPAEKSMWVVDVPRPYNKKELAALKNPKDRTDPDKCDLTKQKDPKKSICPPYKVGDQVEITGEWKTSSPHSERNSDGLLVYKRMKNVTQEYTSPEAAAPDPNATGAQPGEKMSPEDLVKSGKKPG